MRTYLLVDLNNLLYRANYVTNLTDSKNRRISGIFNTMKMVKNLIERFQPYDVVFAWDLGKCKKRIEICPEYKAHRDKKRDPKEMENLQWQRLTCQEIFNLLPVKQIMLEGIEADDIIGYLSKKINSKHEKVIVSNDQDFIQLVGGTTKLYMPNKDKTLTADNVEQFLGFPVKHYVLWKSLNGDSSDNLKGIPGIGPKKATAIILNGLSGNKKVKISKDEMKILDRNKYMMSIDVMLDDNDHSEIVRLYKEQKNKRLKKELIRLKFKKLEMRSLYNDFDKWVKPFVKLLR